MRTDAFTSDAICQCLGIWSFMSDPVCSDSAEVVRLLLTPSFHPEIRLSFTDTNVTAVCARWMVWGMFEPAPMLTDRGSGKFPHLSADLIPAYKKREAQGRELDAELGWGMDLIFDVQDYPDKSFQLLRCKANDLVELRG